ncbi:hypothetical protein [Nodosilinea sp. P-1105]|nr:hypothetical protein [Nodosilinea sp. P-1105]
MSQQENYQSRARSLAKGDRAEVEFDQWAKAVRQQMVAALKRRGSL